LKSKWDCRVSMTAATQCAHYLNISGETHLLPNDQCRHCHPH
jgi:hypothetical protein